jgi:hypothetical protein
MLRLRGLCCGVCPEWHGARRTDPYAFEVQGSPRIKFGMENGSTDHPSSASLESLWQPIPIPHPVPASAPCSSHQKSKNSSRRNRRRRRINNWSRQSPAATDRKSSIPPLPFDVPLPARALPRVAESYPPAVLEAVCQGECQLFGTDPAARRRVISACSSGGCVPGRMSVIWD